MIQLESSKLKSKINPSGAELTSLVYKPSGKELMWQGDKEIWGRHAPVLFPIVGGLKDNKFTYEGEPYQMSRHGFARDSDFEVVNSTDTMCKLRLVYDADTLKHFPFKFELMIMYQLKDQAIVQETVVTNLDSKTMYYGYGQHPAFNYDSPLTELRLTFEKDEEFMRHLLDDDGLRNGEYESIEHSDGVLKLSEDPFTKDAIVLENINSSFVSLSDEKKSFHLRVSWLNYPHLGIWKKTDAPFICIEPWGSMADLAQAQGDIVEKDAVEVLEKGADKLYSMTIEYQA